MKSFARFLALLALVLVIAPPAAYLAGMLNDESLMKTTMLAGTVLWFVAAPIWWREKPNA
ncbi:MAG: hypothetical protein MUE42_04465 [Opitutaceae bacterium]|jgi:hypothetical protein|nr:hypothetical protein [Opitutaceae bacterium]